MHRFLLAAPQQEPVSISDAKVWLRVDRADDDSLILNLIRTARERVEARTGRAILSQTWRVALDRWPADEAVVLPLAPVQQVLAVRVKRLTDEDVVVPTSTLRLLANQEPALLLVPVRPDPEYTRSGIEIDLIAGYGDTPASCPPSLRQAILLMVGQLYEARSPNRDAGVDAALRAETDSLLQPYMSLRLSGSMR